MKRIEPPKLVVLVFLIFGIFFIIAPKNNTTIITPKISQTVGWKEYKNSEYRFSFMYPEGLLSNFHEVPEGKSSSRSYNKILENKNKKVTDPDLYNVEFGADAWKFKGSIQEFLRSGIIEVKNASSQLIIVGNYRGVRITNTESSSDIYYQYNLFKNGDFIYSFALFTDDPVLIMGNQELIDNILTTAKFTN